jgi:hypothetical protein
VAVSNVVIERIGKVDRRPAERRVTGGSGIVASDGRGVLASRDGVTIRITARRTLPLIAMGARLVPGRRGRLVYWLQDDLIGADPEQLPEPAHLGHLRHPAAALPEVDRLRLDADPQREFELGPSLV